MPVTILPLASEHAEPAAILVRERLAALRSGVPELPESCGSPETLVARIASLAHQGLGAAALRGDHLVGFLGAMPIRYAGRRSMMSPEWGNGAARALEPEYERRVCEGLYAAVAEEWTRAKIETHLVCLLAGDAVAVETYSWLGFGRIVCDAVRSLAPVADPQTPCDVRRAVAEDAVRLVELERGLLLHHASSPIFLLPRSPRSADEWSATLSDPSHAVWLAHDGLHGVGYLIQGPAKGDACDIVVDPETSGITGAYVEPGARGRGVATGLLARAVGWAREQGYARLSVDFETANVRGVRFWLTHFRPIVVSLARTIRAEDTP